MLGRLRIKIIVIVLGTLLFVFAAVLLVLNLSVHQTSAKRSEDFMKSVVANDGFLFPPKTAPRERHNAHSSGPFENPETMRAGRFFYAKADKNDNILELNLDMMFDFSVEDAMAYIVSAINAERKKGDIGNFSFMSADKDYGRIIVFAERSIEILILEQLTNISLWVAGIVSLILTFLVVFLAKWMIAPVKIAFDKQRRFISDASHELKTPLTIINANIDVLQNEIGENSRLSHIKGQSERMSGLVHGLLTLAKADERNTDIIRSEFSLSSLVLNTTLEFESRAFEEGKQYSYDIMDNILLIGDEKQIKQLVNILIDNAIRYSEKNGQIKTSLYKEGGRIYITVFNTGIGISNDEQSKIFERFYRSDESRSRDTGGYGVGLSIAKAIAEAHKGKISVTSEYGKWVRFSVKLT